MIELTSEEKEETLQKYRNEWKLDCNINQLNLGDRIFTISSVRQKWFQKKSETKSILFKLNKAKERLIRESLQLDNDVILSRKALESSAKDNDKVRKCIELIDYNNEILEICQCACDNINSTGYDIRNMVEWLKINSN